ncbi:MULTISPECIES: glycosyltransferase family 4 protein [unclassified Coleofasciculus]|uniref:glycosyltransferase family 4 protein n=1 Tax=unclassified Coleofasciculus TaxID=2692782 RepID=UPI00187EE7B9|nr:MULTISPECIES: glycosyltransferase family 4 protein [unclassified Coleofasciculus]MBE9124914.1 glycosyltransferase family 4 protein [Coleofasciculus sp. LEGE 07081]MBE9147841.1 glycosyltransferase family 4 protein [Coleofasciculus sp. LEGE 07092]
MRVAQVSPLWERVPPPGYGGIELVVGHLTDELVRRGHDVTLFASGDSQTLARLESVTPQALRLNPAVKEPAAYDLLQLSRIMAQAEAFDIIHFHTGFTALPFAEMAKTPAVHTLHGGFTEDNRPLFTQYCNQAYISISDAQRKLEPQLNYVRTVYNGINPDDYPFHAQPQDPPYLAFLGRMSPEKGPQHAIAIAKQTGWRLKMAGKVDVVDREFYEQEIAPQIDGEQIQYLGELTHEQKVELLGNATVTLFPITWSEPFGLVMIESMCAGTPVIAMNLGSVSEVIAHGKSGFVCNSVEEMSAAIPAAIELNRQQCHDFVVQHFSVTQMVDSYEAAYHKILNEQMSRNGHVHAPVLSL